MKHINLLFFQSKSFKENYSSKFKLINYKYVVSEEKNKKVFQN